MAAESSQDVRLAIEAANRRVMEAVTGGDAAGIAALYTAGGQLLPPQSETLSLTHPHKTSRRLR